MIISLAIALRQLRMTANIHVTEEIKGRSAEYNLCSKLSFINMS